MTAKKYFYIFSLAACVFAITAMLIGHTYLLAALLVMAIISIVISISYGRKIGKSTSEQFYENILEQSGVSTIITDKDGIIRFTSKNIERLYGYGNEDMGGMHITECIPAAFRQALQEIIGLLKNKGEYNDTFHTQVFTKAHLKRWVACRIHRMTDDDNYRIQVMVWDTNDEKTLELELGHVEMNNKRQQKLLKTIIDHSPALIYIKDLQSNFILSNTKTKLLAGVDNDDDINKVVIHTNEEKKRFYRELDLQVIKEKRMITVEDEYTYRNGTTVTFWVMRFPIFGQDGEVEYIGGISTDISTLKQSEQIIIAARKEAEQAKYAQEAFMANMSHEIRTPMNGIIGMANLLLDSQLNTEQKENMEAINESAHNLLAIINDLLDFSKIKSGKFHLESVPFKPRDVIKKTMYPLLIKANEKDVALKCLIDTSVPETIIGDPLRLQQIIINLVGNALKFTDRGYVEIKLHPISINKNVLWLGVDVTDTGIGIPADKLDLIFESYAQSDVNTSRIYGGTGLGLAIVKQLAELQNGTISVKSTVNTGSAFMVEIPYKIHEANIDSNDSASAKVRSGMLNGIRVLVAEDNLINQKVVMKTLIKQNALVEVSDNGQLAIDKLLSQPFDIILMDLQMPVMNGYESVNYIRNVMKSNIPIIAMTADAIQGEDAKCFEIGMNAYISKPFNPADLYNKIEQLAANKSIR